MIRLLSELQNFTRTTRLWKGGFGFLGIRPRVTLTWTCYRKQWRRNFSLFYHWKWRVKVTVSWFYRCFNKETSQSCLQGLHGRPVSLISRAGFSTVRINLTIVDAPDISCSVWCPLVRAPDATNNVKEITKPKKWPQRMVDRGRQGDWKDRLLAVLGIFSDWLGVLIRENQVQLRWSKNPDAH